MTLQGRTNAFNGLEIDGEAIPDAEAELRALFPSRMAQWREDGLSLIWLRVPLAKSFAIPTAVEQGFVFHHSQADYVMLTCALEPGAFIPPYATHFVGAGGVVLDSRQRLLVVNERFRGNRSEPFWKLPGGLLDPGEHLEAGVRREVLEETGIETRFDRLVVAWHNHRYQFGKSGFYMVCRLTPLTFDICKDNFEIDDCRWMPLEEYLASPHVASFNRVIVEAAVANPTLAETVLPFYPDPDRHEFFFPPTPWPLAPETVP